MQRVIVIGAGPGGLAAAIGLRRTGFEVEVFERSPELHDVGAGLALWPNAVKALARLDLAEAVRPLAVPFISAGVSTWRGAPLLRASTDDLASKFGAPSLVVHRAELQAALLDALGPEHVRLGA